MWQLLKNCCNGRQGATGVRLEVQPVIPYPMQLFYHVTIRFATVILKYFLTSSHRCDMGPEIVKMTTIEYRGASDILTVQTATSSA